MSECVVSVLFVNQSQSPPSTHRHLNIDQHQVLFYSSNAEQKKYDLLHSISRDHLIYFHDAEQLQRIRTSIYIYNFQN